MKILFNRIKLYLSKELLYITIIILSYILYKTFSHHPTILHFLHQSLFHVNLKNPEASYYASIMTWFLTSFLYLFLFPFIFVFLIEGKKIWKKLGLSFPISRKNLLILLGSIAIMWLLMILAVKIFPAFTKTYPFAKFILNHPTRIVFYETAYFFFFFAWEFFSHSLMLFPFEEKFGKSGAILIGLMPFVIMHIGKPFPELIGSFFAGIFLSILALETRTFWYGVLLHGVVAVSMDIIAILLR